jgi:hypothetical protein
LVEGCPGAASWGYAGESRRRVDFRTDLTDIGNGEASVADDVGDDAQRLLQAVTEHQAKRRLGETVVPEEVAHHAGLHPGTERYNKAVQHLIDERAIEEDERYRLVASGDHPGGTLYFKITQRGRDMLRE